MYGITNRRQPDWSIRVALAKRFVLSVRWYDFGVRIENKVPEPRAEKNVLHFPLGGRHARAPKGRLACLMLMFVRL
jgi:hypothetical protein